MKKLIVIWATLFLFACTNMFTELSDPLESPSWIRGEWKLFGESEPYFTFYPTDVFWGNSDLYNLYNECKIHDEFTDTQYIITYYLDPNHNTLKVELIFTSIDATRIEFKDYLDNQLGNTKVLYKM